MGLAHSTVRTYQGMVEAFFSYATSPAYDWPEQSAAMFGSVYFQVIMEFNRVKHSQGTRLDPRSELPHAAGCSSCSIFATSSMIACSSLAGVARSPPSATRPRSRSRTGGGFVRTR